jgi:membrane protein DedA with SNARE-associated domain
VLAHVVPLRVAAVAIRLHHRFHGPRGDYFGLAGAAVASWAGLPGPGEAALITAGVLAAHHKLDLLSVVATAWAGATVGGTAGWWIGLKAGREVVTKSGPLHHFRIAALERGDRFYERFGLLGVFFAPSWVAGIHGMRPISFIAANAVSALIWALMFGLGAYFLGPTVADLVVDLGLVGGILIGALAIAAVVGVIVRSRRRK